MVAPQYQEELKEILDAKNVPYHVMIEDVQALVDSQLKGVDTAVDFDYTKYHTYAEVGFRSIFCNENVFTSKAKTSLSCPNAQEKHIF